MVGKVTVGLALYWPCTCHRLNSLTHGRVQGISNEISTPSIHLSVQYVNYSDSRVSCIEVGLGDVSSRTVEQ